MITVTHPHIPEITAHDTGVFWCLISDVLFYSCSCVECLCLLCIPAPALGGVGGGAGLWLQEMMHSDWLDKCWIVTLPLSPSPASELTIASPTCPCCRARISRWMLAVCNFNVLLWTQGGSKVNFIKCSLKLKNLNFTLNVHCKIFGRVKRNILCCQIISSVLSVPCVLLQHYRI